MIEDLTLMVMDGELSSQIANVYTRFNSWGTMLDLYTNDFAPDPEAVTGDFTVPTFTGYAAVALLDVLTDPARDEKGVWSFQSEIFTFEITESDEGPVTIHGARINAFGTTIAAGRLVTPKELTYGGTPLRLRLVYTQYAGLRLLELNDL